MSRAHSFRVATSTGGFDFITAKRAKAAIARGDAYLVNPHSFGRLARVIRFVDKPQHAAAAAAALRPPKPAWGADLKAEQIPASHDDAEPGQTFLRYPQRSQDSYAGAYPALARPGAGLERIPKHGGGPAQGDGEAGAEKGGPAARPT